MWYTDSRLFNDVHALIPGTCEYIMLHDKEYFAGVFKGYRP